MWQWSSHQGDQRPGDPLQGVWLGEEGAPGDGVVGWLEVDSRGDLEQRFGPEDGQWIRRYTDLACRDGDRGRQRDRARLTGMAAAADWITLSEAAEILAAANIHFTPATIGGWARSGRLQSIKLGGRRFVRRGEVRALVAGPRRVRAEDLQSGLFEDLG